jgi:hypothetical protein
MRLSVGLRDQDDRGALDVEMEKEARPVQEQNEELQQMQEQLQQPASPALLGSAAALLLCFSQSGQLVHPVASLHFPRHLPQGLHHRFYQAFFFLQKSVGELCRKGKVCVS